MRESPDARDALLRFYVAFTEATPGDMELFDRVSRESKTCSSSAPPTTSRPSGARQRPRTEGASRAEVVDPHHAVVDVVEVGPWEQRDPDSAPVGVKHVLAMVR